MKVKAKWATHQGLVRGHNEDYCLCDPDLGLYMVCDGMGGHQAGEVASKLAAETVHEVLSESAGMIGDFADGKIPADGPVWLVRGAVEAASKAVYDHSTASTGHGGMGTTCTLLLMGEGRAIMGHVGDSRLYLFRDGKVNQLSEDHTYLNDAIRRGLMTPEEAAQSEYTNIITRAVGTQPGAQVDTLVFDLAPDDTLLICSDGLSGYLEEHAELSGLLSLDNVDLMPDFLIDLANERGGEDNITAVVVRAVAEEAKKAEVAPAIGDHDALRGFPMFQDLPLADLARVLTAFERRDLTTGQVLVQQGLPYNELVAVTRGSLEVTGDGRETLLPAGTAFGEGSFFSKRRSDVTIRAAEPAQVLVARKDRFSRMLREDSMLAAGILWSIAETLTGRLDAGAGPGPVGARADEHDGSSPFDRRSLF